jgi:hypothetical protein
MNNPKPTGITAEEIWNKHLQAGIKGTTGDTVKITKEMVVAAMEEYTLTKAAPVVVNGYTKEQMAECWDESSLRYDIDKGRSPGFETFLSSLPAPLELPDNDSCRAKFFELFSITLTTTGGDLNNFITYCQTPTK